jgi:PAS domain S-box-containing protein
MRMGDIKPESYFKDLFEQTSDLIQILNMDGQIITVNPSWLFHLGYSAAEVKLHSIYDFIKTEYHELFRHHRKEVIKGYEAKEIEFEMITKDGRSIVVKGQVRMLENTTDLPYTCAVLKDITAQKMIERQSEQTQIRLSKFFRHAPDAVIVINEKQIVVEWNLKAELIFGYTYDQAFGVPLSELIIPPRYREAHLQGMKHFMSTGIGPVLNKTIEISALHNSGNEFPVSLSISNVKIDDEWMFVAFITDITKRKELEALAVEKETALLRSQLLDERKTNFLTIASHELKTPLTSIKGYTQLAYNMAKNDKDSKIRPFLIKIDEQTNKLSHLVNELMDLSKIDTGKLSINKQPVEFDKFLKETIDSLRQGIKQHPIIVASSAVVRIEIDASRIEQVINNLVSNAEKYSESGSAIEISSYTRQGFLILQVSDKGIGLAEENFELIFDRFFRVKEITNHINGFGIGLFICSEIIKQHNGHIWVESKLGEGSTFSFSLPLSDKKP